MITTLKITTRAGDVYGQRERTESIEIQGENHLKTVAPPPYSPNAWAELAHFLARDPSCEYFQGHRGDF